jgi:hypothetical protein
MTMQILTRALELRDLIIATLHPIFCRSLSRLIILYALKVGKKILSTAIRAVILLREINFAFGGREKNGGNEIRSRRNIAFLIKVLLRNMRAKVYGQPKVCLCIFQRPPC